MTANPMNSEQNEKSRLSSMAALDFGGSKHVRAAQEVVGYLQTYIPYSIVLIWNLSAVLKQTRSFILEKHCKIQFKANIRNLDQSGKFAITADLIGIEAFPNPQL